MKASSFKSYYSRFLAGCEGKWHFAAHSHHFWPDVTREAQLQVWDDAARFNDAKWGHIFAEVLPKTRGHIASILGLKDSEQIALAPNTHELLTKIFSVLPRGKKKVLTTDSEFHSFGRQLRRWEEDGDVEVVRLEADALLKDRSQWLTNAQTQIRTGLFDIVFISQVFFNSGLALSDQELETLFKDAPKETVLVVDGYHAFAAIPTSLTKLEGRIFYLGGGYKYAQGGEGVGFAVVPKGDWRPALTGWYSEFSQLSAPRANLVPYSQDGMAFWGATQDPSGWYRFNAVWDLFQREGLTVQKGHEYVQSLQNAFLKAMPELAGFHPCFDSSLASQGHFLTYEAPEEAQAASLQATLLSEGIIIDRRSRRLRFGFGLYQDLADVEQLIKILREIKL